MALNNFVRIPTSRYSQVCRWVCVASHYTTIYTWLQKCRHLKSFTINSDSNSDPVRLYGLDVHDFHCWLHTRNDEGYPSFPKRNDFPWITRVSHWLYTSVNISHKGIGSHCSWIMLLRCQYFLQLSVMNSTYARILFFLS